MKAGPRTKVRMLNKQGLMQAEQPGRLLCGRPFGCKFSTAEAVNHPHVFPLGTHIYPGQLWLVFAYLHMTVWDIFGETFLIIDIKIQFFFLNLEGYFMIALSIIPVSNINNIIFRKGVMKTAWNTSSVSQVWMNLEVTQTYLVVENKGLFIEQLFSFLDFVPGLTFAHYSLKKNFDLWWKMLIHFQAESSEKVNTVRYEATGLSC